MTKTEIDRIKFYTYEDNDNTVHGTFVLEIKGEDYSFSLTDLFVQMSLFDLKRVHRRLENEIKKKEKETK